LSGGVGLGGALDGLHGCAVEHHGLVPAARLDLRAPCAKTPHNEDDDDDARGNQTRTYTQMHTAAAAAAAAAKAAANKGSVVVAGRTEGGAMIAWGR